MRRAVVLTGGVGGAKFVQGLADVLPEGAVTAVVNTGDDFRHLGLHVSPDIDTLLYTLSGRADPERGWGREGETWAFMGALAELGGPGWFQLGDRDLALHVLRTQHLAGGGSLSAFTAEVARRWTLPLGVLPMSDAPVATVLDTDEGALEFQRYFVARRCEPAVRAVRFEGADAAAPAPGVLEAIAEADAVFVAPSNPYLSVAPILAVPAIRAALGSARAPVVAVSPLVGGEAVKGPTAKLMRELGAPVDHAGVAALYPGLLDGLVIEATDPWTGGAAPAVGRAATLMRTREDKRRVARAALELAERLAR